MTVLVFAGLAEVVVMGAADADQEALDGQRMGDAA